MNIKIILAVVVIIGALVFGAMSFVETNVEYADFKEAESSSRKVQVKGTWVQDRETRFDTEKSQFTFYMADDFGKVQQVVYEGAKPNNFEIADALDKALAPKGVAVVVECAHMCMVMRGVQKVGAMTVTRAMTGQFRTDSRLRREFFSLIGKVAT